MRTVPTLITFFVCITLFFPSGAQDQVGINEIQLNIPPKGEKPAFEFYIPDWDADAVLAAWTRFHRSFEVLPSPFGRDANYFISDNASIELLSENTIDIYTRIYATGSGVRFACAFDLGGVFVSSRKTPEKYNTARTILNRFYAGMVHDAIVEELQKEQKRLKDLEADRDSIAALIADLNAAGTGQWAVIDSANGMTTVLTAKKQQLSLRLDSSRTALGDLRSGNLNTGISASADSISPETRIRELKDAIKDISEQLKTIDGQLFAYEEAVITAREILAELQSRSEPLKTAHASMEEAVSEQQETIKELEEIQSSIR